MVDAALVLIPEVYVTGALFARVDPANTASVRLPTGRGLQFDGHHEGVDHYRLPSSTTAVRVLLPCLRQ